MTPFDWFVLAALVLLYLRGWATNSYVKESDRQFKAFKTHIEEYLNRLTDEA